MAEVEIDIKGTDNATPAFEQIEQSASSAIGVLKGFETLELNRKLELDSSGALDAINMVRAHLDSIPNITYKDLIMRVKTQASPVRPFSEGMAYVRKELESLPKSGEFVMRMNKDEAGGSPQGGVAHLASGSGVVFSPTVNVSAGTGGAEIARDIDRALASLWSEGRSELRRAING